MQQSTLSEQYLHEAKMHPKSWFNVPYNYFFVVFYVLLAVSLSVHPTNEVTREIAGGYAPVLGRFIGLLFFVMGFVLWRKEPRGEWMMLSALPGVVWGGYRMVHLLGADSRAWDEAVYISVACALLLFCAELRQTLHNNEAVNESLIKEIELLKAKVSQATPDDQRPA